MWQVYKKYLAHISLIREKQMNTQEQKNTVEGIQVQNEVLLLSAQKKQLIQEVNDRKDLMRKLRQKEVVIKQSNYCQVGGFQLKKKPTQIYPLLERQVNRITKLKQQTHLKLISQLKMVIKLLERKQVTKIDLDLQVRGMLEQFQDELEL